MAKTTRERDVATRWNDFTLSVVVFASEAVFVFVVGGGVVPAAAAALFCFVYRLLFGVCFRRRRARVTDDWLIRGSAFLFITRTDATAKREVWHSFQRR